MRAMRRRRKAIWVCSGSSSGQNVVAASRVMQPNTTVVVADELVEVLVRAGVARVQGEARDLVQAHRSHEVLAHARRAAAATQQPHSMQRSSS